MLTLQSQKLVKQSEYQESNRLSYTGNYWTLGKLKALLSLQESSELAELG